MKDLHNEELLELNGGGFAYDMGCLWRYAGHFTYGYIAGGGPISPSSVSTGYILAEATKCP